ncbi:MAG: hypothetical protein PHQ25_08965 [Acidobacteriota bacterium]|nr:hypothetical protein [Acidobacteriota bacterium]MDW3229917.1 hypothetical protein [Acidobacteriota bacterium]
MKKNLIILVLICLLVISLSFSYKYYKLNLYSEFPLELAASRSMKEIPFYLFLYFHSNDCPQCLGIISLLNNLPPHYIVRGVIPDDEISNSEIIRESTGAIFEFEPVSKYKKFMPLISPCLIGVSKEKAILFVLPSVPDQEKYLREFLESFYYNRVFFGYEKYISK